MAQSLSASGYPVSLKKRAVSHQVPKPRDARRRDGKIDVSDLDEIIAIDREAMTCTAEPGVTFADLVEATLPHGLAPIIVPELRTITVGGAVAGCSLESMSFVHGGFHDTCLAYEIITSDGAVLRTTPNNEHRLVHEMMHGSFGTLGVLSQLQFALTPAKPYVHLKHRRYGSLSDYQEAIRRHCRERDVDFMDGIIHSPTQLSLCLGRFSERAPYTSRYDWTQVYYLSTRDRDEDYLRTPDYYFRYDRGVTNVHPRSKLGRLLFGKLLGSTQVLRLAERVPWLLREDRLPITVDLFIPFSRWTAFMDWYDRAIGFYPLWCVPYRRPRHYEWIDDGFFDGVDDELFVDLAIYGLKPRADRDYYAMLEQALLALRGIKTLISFNRYDEPTFWSIYNRPNHLAAKQITDPRGIFRDLYDKTCLAPRGQTRQSIRANVSV